MKALRTLILILALGLATPLCTAQERTARADYDFCNYLLGQGLMRDALTLTSSLSTDYTPAALDTLSYLQGFVLYHNRKFTPASEAFAKVGQDSHFFPHSTFLGSYCDLESGHTTKAKQRLDRFALTPAAESHRELLAFQRAGIALLEGDRNLYDQLRNEFTYNHFALAPEQHNLDKIAANPPRNLKPWVAGVASAIVPGLGQIYAGNVGEGVASFLLVGAFATLTANTWAQAGTPINWRTLTYGSIASLLYIGNICGSIASVKVYYQNFEEINRQAVMYSIHIPLRYIFD